MLKKLDPSCEISTTDWHYIIKITKDGESRYFGGAGAGTADPMLDTRISERFSFDNSDNDYSTQVTLEKLKKLLSSYANYAEDDFSKYDDILSGDTFEKTIGNGSWMRINIEGTSLSTYAYEVKILGTYSAVSDAWVDGRYISEN